MPKYYPKGCFLALDWSVQPPLLLVVMIPQPQCHLGVIHLYTVTHAPLIFIPITLKKHLETPTNRETYPGNRRFKPIKYSICHKQECASGKLSLGQVMSCWSNFQQLFTPQQPENIILSFGLNNRSTKHKSTSLHNLRKVIGATMKTFPKSEIYFPLVNFSPNLPQIEIGNLKKLNHLAKHYLCRVRIIPCLDLSHFETTSDPVHWTKQSIWYPNSLLIKVYYT